MRIGSSKPFGAINLFDQPDGTRKIQATIFQIPAPDGSYVHNVLAIDGSNSMRQYFGPSGPFNAGINLVEPVVRGCGEFLADLCDGKVTIFYWACGYDGSEVVEVGNLTVEEVTKEKFSGPGRKWGKGTQLLPAVKRAVKELEPTEWGMAIIISDGIWTDHDQVKEYTLQMAEEIANGKRNDLKLVLVGVGDEVSQQQIDDLNDMDYKGLVDPKTNEAFDLWDAMLASEMSEVEDLVGEIASAPIPMSGKLLDDKGNIVTNYPDIIPGRLVFDLPPGTKSFTLEVGGEKYTQELP